MKSLEVLSAKLNEETGFIEVIKLITNDDDTTEFAGHSIHPETLEWWAAVYGINNKDELIDMILFEPYVENVSPMTMTEAEARTVHQGRINTFKSTFNKTVSRVRSTELIKKSEVDNQYATQEDPYEFIKRVSPFDVKVVDVKKNHINNIRKSNIVAKDKMIMGAKDREADLKAKLLPPRSREAQATTSKPTTPTPPPVILEKRKKVG